MKLVQSLPALDAAKPAKPKSAAGYTQADLDAGHIYVAEAKPDDELI